ncbi:MAG: quinone oxidoreductase [Chloroflexi bacterium]|nr:quinone oxidoreductase [Chloroflexota bacterium]
MKAVRVHEYGGPEALRLDNVELPRPGPSQVLVQIAYAGLNFIDIYQRTGRYQLASLPWTLGLEGSGTVKALGEGVTELAVGQRVAWVSTPGSYAEYVLGQADRLLPVPDGVSDADAAAVVLQGMTAHYLLTSVHETKPGDWVLVHAAAGGVGTLAVQVAKLKGANVIGTVGSPDKVRVARDAGADHVVNYSEADFVAVASELTGGRGVDVVLDGVGKTTFPKSIEATRDRGRVIIFGSASGVADPIAPNSLQPKALTISGANLASYTATHEELIWRAGDLFTWVAAGQVKPLIGRVLPLDQTAVAHKLLVARQTVGKVLIQTT